MHYILYSTFAHIFLFLEVTLPGSAGDSGPNQTSNFSYAEHKSLFGSTQKNKVHSFDSNVGINLSNLSLITMYNACFRERRELWNAKINYTNACTLFGT